MVEIDDDRRGSDASTSYAAGFDSAVRALRFGRTCVIEQVKESISRRDQTAGEGHGTAARRGSRLGGTPSRCLKQC